jgi:6-pyruvoyltetrahydropterin/6-carboxytetrahydropterin synthase
MEDSYIIIDGWHAQIRFSAAHVIPEYKKCGRLHGHTYAVHTKIYGTLDENGIIIDFSLLKKKLRNIVDTLDHKIIIPDKNTNITITKDQTSITLNSLGKTYTFPKEDCVLLPIFSSSAENLSLYILDALIDELKEFSSINAIEIGVDEGYGQGARVVKKIQ